MGIMGFLCLPLRHPALASARDRILGWKDYRSVQLKEFLHPNTKLIVPSLRLHTAKLPALCIATGRAKVRLKTHFFLMLLDATQPSDPTQAPRLTVSPTLGYSHPTLSGDQHIDARDRQAQHDAVLSSYAQEIPQPPASCAGDTRSTNLCSSSYNTGGL